ncbi:MAG: single-stranded DNA-binding protein [Ruminococcus sp.]|nr:single-stranded DNA-binding protein [Ruminococcus sp.]
MLNRVIIMGRITQDLEIKQAGGQPVVSFTIAVERGYTDQNGQRPVDFIDCVAWRQHAEFIGRYFGKGRMIAVEGELRKRDYTDKNGNKRYVTEVYVTNTSFTGESKRDGNGNGASYQSNGGYNNNGYNNNSYQQPQQNNYQPQYNQPPQQNNMSIGGMEDFEEIISDDGVPF